MANKLPVKIYVGGQAMFKNTGIVKVFLFLACLYLVDVAKKAGYINVWVQVVIIVILMVFFLFGKQLIQKLKK